MPKIYKNNKKHINPRYFLNEAAELDILNLVKKKYAALVKYETAPDDETDAKERAHSEMILAIAAIANLPPEYNQMVDDLEFEMKERFDKVRDDIYAERPTPLGHGDIDLDKI